MEIKTKFEIGEIVLDGSSNSPIECIIHGISYFFGKNIIKNNSSYETTSYNFPPSLCYVISYINSTMSYYKEINEEYLFKNINEFKEYRIKELEELVKHYNDLLREYE